MTVGHTHSGEGGDMSPAASPVSGTGCVDSAPRPQDDMIQSEHVLLDVLGEGRFRLEKHFKAGGGKVPVTIAGYIEYPFGSDDGESIEFVVRPTCVLARIPSEVSL